MWASEVIRDTLGFEDLIGKFSVCFESERFGKDKGIIAVKEDFFDLRVKRWLSNVSEERKICDVITYRRHLGMLMQEWV